MLQVKTTDKVYIDGPRCSKTLADVLLERFERVSQVSLLYFRINRSRVSPLNCLQYDWAWEFPDCILLVLDDTKYEG